MNQKIKIVLLICAVELVLAINCQGQANKQKTKEKWGKDSADIKLTVAQKQFEAGQLEQAEESLKQCLAVEPNMAKAKLLLGKVKFAEDDFNGAKSCFQDYVRSNNKDDAGLFMLGLTYERLGDRTSAVEWYKKAMAIMPENTDYVIAVGQMYQATGDFNSAEKLYMGKIASNPTNTDLKVAAAQMYLSQNKNDKALQLYEQASMLKPENSKLLEALGSCYILISQWDKALEVHQQLYSRSSSPEEKNRYLKTMAITATNAGDYSDAMKYYGQLAAQDKHNAQLWFSMGQAALGGGSLKQAIICSQKAIELSPDMKEAWLLSGSANYKSGNYQQAADDFQKASDDTECAEFAWMMISRCYMKLGKTEQANMAYQKVKQFEAGNEIGQLMTEINGEN